MRYLRWLIAAPFLLLLVLFALSNTTTLKLGMWPTDYTIEWPASAVILVAMAIAFMAGALLMWISELGQRRRARRAEQALKLLEEQVKGLQANLAAPSSTAGEPRST
ncbi:MAG TPA: LapA family protein [Acetobacteraceae bacterium]|jgi:putative membrane protein|nr:LapA family protein [Acetobacteraceae bacterium]